MSQSDTIAHFLSWIIDDTNWSVEYPLNWEERVMHFGVKKGKKQIDPLPTTGGLYRIWMEGDRIDSYYGQSENLRRRAKEANHSYDEEMPFTDPHTVAPAFWACLHDYPGLRLYISVAPFEASDYWRQGIEDYVTAFHRWRFGQSPRWNYSRMPRNWSRPSDKKGGVRGEATDAYLPCHHPGITPPITNFFEDSQPTDLEWAGYRWSDWQEASTAVKGVGKSGRGLYRLRKKDASTLYFIGKGSFSNALREAVSKERDLVFSAVAGDWEEHQLRELRTDCLGLYLRQMHSLPYAQYGGENKKHEGPLLPRLQEKAFWLMSLLSSVAVERQPLLSSVG